MWIQSSDRFEMMNRARINPEVTLERCQQAVGVDTLWLLLEHIVQHELYLVLEPTTPEETLGESDKGPAEIGLQPSVCRG